MWTPKRVVLLLAGFGFFFSSYGVYAHFLGGIDGLPPLPEGYWPGQAAVAEAAPTPPRTTLVEAKLEQAFGSESDVLRRLVKVEADNGMVLATDDFVIQPDGRVKLQPFRIALFGKTDDDHATAEINTVSSDTAFLKFDQPVSNLTDMGSRKIIACDLIGNVNIVNNRRTLQRDDDLSLFTQGPVFYQEDKNLIWTDAVVKLQDLQSKPQPTQINATGMDVYLIKDKAAARPARGSRNKLRPDSVSGVERIVLRSRVRMDLYVDAHSGFLASGGKLDGKPAAAETPPATPAAGDTAAARPPAKAHVVITTDGRFLYDVAKDYAQFDVPSRPSPARVNVTRENQPAQADQPGKLDQLDCDHLELQFTRKASPGTGPATPQDDRSGLAIESAHATANPANNVILLSDAEMLEARGNELFYNARTRTSTLRGEKQIYALKEGNEMLARELQLVDQQGFQQATAMGPGGEIHMFDPKATGNKRHMHAYWNDKLVSSKEGAFNCLTLTGNAVFEDQDYDQFLRGQFLKVWLQPGEHGTAGESAQDHLRPHHLEAKGHVTADSSDMHVKEPTEHLVIWFKDVPAKGDERPRQPVAATVAPSAGALLTGKSAGPQAPAGAGPPLLSAPIRVIPEGPQGAPTAAKTKKPMDLSARSIEAFVLRSDNKNELERLWCEGTVVVHQDPATAEEKGVDIRGETLQLNQAPDGRILVVTGDLARVQLDKITIHGPEVTIDQQSNLAKVHGPGIMLMPAATDFNGAKLAKPGELTIRWKSEMLFNGRQAWFDGDVQANQGTGGLLCQKMEVVLDRPVSFKEGDKGAPPPKVERLVCDKNVYLEDSPREDGRVTGYQRLTTPELAVDYEYGLVNAGGPGTVHIVGMGGAGDGGLGLPAGGPAKPPAAAPAPKRTGKQTQDDWTLTQVKYLKRLSANNEKRTAVFYGNVEVMHVPVGPRVVLDHSGLNLDKDHPPVGCMYLRCEQLKVFTRLLPNNRKSQQMEAERNCLVRAREFWGTAAVVKYDEEQDRVIFEGGDSNLAALYRLTAEGRQWDKITGKKIYYWRQTGAYRVDDSGVTNLNPQ